MATSIVAVFRFAPYIDFVLAKESMMSFCDIRCTISIEIIMDRSMPTKGSLIRMFGQSWQFSVAMSTNMFISSESALKH